MQCLREDGLDEEVNEDETEATVFEGDQEVHIKEAWEAPKKKKSYMAILTVIGEITNKNGAEAYNIIPQERECCPCQCF